MKNIILVIAVVFTIVSCHKKNEDPQPSSNSSSKLDVYFQNFDTVKCVLVSNKSFSIGDVVATSTDTGYVYKGSLIDPTGSKECHVVANMINSSLVKVYCPSGGYKVVVFINDQPVAQGASHQTAHMYSFYI